MDQIGQKEMTDNVVTLMADKIIKQPIAIQTILQIAACIGNQFDVQTVAWVSETSVQKTYEHILQGIGIGFFEPLDEKFK